MIVEAHPGHLGDHLAAEGVGFFRADAAGQRLVEQGGCLRLREVLGAGGGMAVVGRGAAIGLEKGAPDAVRLEIAVPGGGVGPGDGAEPLDIVGEAGEFGVDNRIGAVGGDHPAGPAGAADHFMPAQIVEGTVGGGDNLDAEALEQSARAEGRFGQSRGDGVVNLIGGLGGQALIDAEHFREGVVEPYAARGGAEEMVVLGETAPDLARIALHRPAVDARDAERLQRDALGMEHPEDVVVGDDEELGGIGEGLVLGEPARIGVAVRADDRQRCDRAMKGPCQSARGRIQRK